MKKLINTGVSSLLTLLLTFSLAGCGNISVNFDDDDQEIHEANLSHFSKNFSGKEIKDIEISGHNLDFDVVAGSAYYLDVRYARKKPTVELQNQRLVFDSEQSQKKVKASLHIPNDKLVNSINFNATNSDLNLHSLKIKKFKISSNNSDIEIKHSTIMETSNIDLVNGEVELEQVQYPGIKIDVANGEIEIHDGEISGKTYQEGDTEKVLNINVNNGSVNIE